MSFQLLLFRVSMEGLVLSYWMMFSVQEMRVLFPNALILALEPTTVSILKMLV